MYKVQKIVVTTLATLELSVCKASVFFMFGDLER
jgi:hypothetical protein